MPPRIVLLPGRGHCWAQSCEGSHSCRVCNLRCQPDAQKETADVSWEIDTLTKDLFPVSWDALRSSE